MTFKSDRLDDHHITHNILYSGQKVGDGNCKMPFRHRKMTVAKTEWPQALAVGVTNSITFFVPCPIGQVVLWLYIWILLGNDLTDLTDTPHPRNMNQAACYFKPRWKFFPYGHDKKHRQKISFSFLLFSPTHSFPPFPPIFDFKPTFDSFFVTC